MTDKPILIAGATGTNGQALIAELDKRNIPVRIMSSSLARAQELFGSDREIVVADLMKPDSLKAAFEDVEKAYIVTAVTPDAVLYFENFYAAAKNAGVKHLVKFSGLGAELDSPSEIIRQHAESDEMLRKSGLTYTILRPNSFHQNMLWQAASIAQTGQFYLPLADARQSTIDVRDIAEITANILTRDGHENRDYNLTGPESLSFTDVAHQLGEVRKGAEVSYIPVPVEAAEAAMKEQGMPDWHAHALAEIQDLFATGKYAEVLPDSEILLGRKPRSFLAFARDHAEAFQ